MTQIIRPSLLIFLDLRPQAECLEKFTSDPIYRGALLHYL
jgi:hypothetical protein